MFHNEVVIFGTRVGDYVLMDYIAENYGWTRFFGAKCSWGSEWGKND